MKQKPVLSYHTTFLQLTLVDKNNIDNDMRKPSDRNEKWRRYDKKFEP
jgi:hypothetical protein